MKRFFFITLSIAIPCCLSTRLHAQAVTFTGQELLGRPTQSSITINVVANQALEAYFEYGTQPGVYTHQTSIINSIANEPIETTLTGLQPNTEYYYRMVYRSTGTTTWTQRTEHSFRTQRASGSTFQFDITSDSHVNILLGLSATWQRTLTNIRNDDPDFMIDCGDTFNMDTTSSESSARNSYLFQRSSTTFGVVSPSVPVFLAVGNHEEQEAWHLNDNGNPVNSQPVWSTNAQKRYFLNPVPDAFYSGNSDTYFALDGDQLREDYYAWTWGNALFVVIDPYWYTTQKPFIGNTGGGEPGTSDGDRWHWTLGETQYNWLRQTLQNSTASYKFLFMHHMTGGTSDYIRGGAYGSPYCEWGGYDENGTTYSFNTRRPGWYAPIHQLLTENHVSAVFHGHDHQYAYEILDGVVYQALPAAGFGGNGFNEYNQNDPLTIRVLPSSGHLRVTVAPLVATVEYVSSSTATNGQVLHAYNILATQQGPLPVTLEFFNLLTENNRKVVLDWKTSWEYQNKHFIVQRAVAGSGTFKDIGVVPASNSQQGSTYRFSDEPAVSGSYLYRLRQEDIDGRQTYSGTRLAVIRNGSNWQLIDKSTSWELQSGRPVSYTLWDLAGRQLATGNFTGTKSITKPMTGSLYILRIVCDGQVDVRKLVR